MIYSNYHVKFSDTSYVGSVNREGSLAGLGIYVHIDPGSACPLNPSQVNGGQSCAAVSKDSAVG